MPIVCQSETTNYTLVEAVTVVKPGRDLALALGTSGEVLIGAFRSPDGAGSALCLYKMSDIRSRIADNQRYCYNNSDEYLGQQFEFPGRRQPKCTKSLVSNN
jgi:Sema domain